MVLAGVMLNVCVAASFFRQPVTLSSLNVSGKTNLHDTKTYLSVEDDTDVTEARTSERRLLSINNYDNNSHSNSNINHDTSIYDNSNHDNSNYDNSNHDNSNHDNGNVNVCTNKLSSTRLPKTGKCKYAQITTTCVAHCECSLFKNSRFIIYVASFFLHVIAAKSSCMFLPARSESIGLSKQQVAMAMSAYGVAELIGRLLWGWFGDLKCIVGHRKYMYAVSMVPCGVAAMFIPFVNSFESTLAYAIIIGLFAGCFWALLMAMLVDAFGLETMSSAFGKTVFCLAFANMIGPPLLGKYG
jgi:hypothetical protein